MDNCTVEMYTEAGSFSLYRALTGGGELSGSGLIWYGTTAPVQFMAPVHSIKLVHNKNTHEKDLILEVWSLEILLTLYMWQLEISNKF